MNFLPDDYQAPRSKNTLYFKPQDGENRIRILSKPIFGFEYWTEQKVTRHSGNEPMGKDAKYFWAMIVWNVDLSLIQIYLPTQKTIHGALEQLAKDADWGSPFNYDIKIFRKGEKMETEYLVNPVPHKPVSENVLKAFKDTPIQLEALYQGLDPFATGYTQYTPLMSESEESKVVKLMGEKVDVKPLYIGHAEFIELSELKNGCEPKMQEGFSEYLKKGFGIETLAHLEMKNYEEVKAKLKHRFDENQKLEAEMNDTPESRKKK